MNKKIIKNAKVYTVDKNNPWCEAILIEDEIIKAVGNEAEVMQEVSGDVQIIDAGGKLILPGFIDAHCHPTVATYRLNNMDMFGCTSIDEYQQEIKRFSDQHPEKDIIKGSGWMYTYFQDGNPHKSIIDKVVNDRPVMIYSADFHSLWVNSKALELAEIPRDMENPHGGIMERDEDGELTGYFNEAPASKIIEERLSSFTPEDYKAGILDFIQDANSVGITAIKDAGILDEMGWRGYSLMNDEEYTASINIDNMITPSMFANLHDAVVFTDGKKKEYENGHVKLTTIKLLIDGVPEANTALLEEPYIDEPDNSGVPLWDENRYKEIIQLGDKAGYQIHVHCIGNRGLRYTLDAFENAAKINGKRDSRHMTAHLQLVNEDDIPRMAELGVIANPQSLWFEKGDMYYEVELNNLGKDRADREYPMKSFIDAGVTVACGSDSPVSLMKPIRDVSFPPLQAIQQGITRTNPLKNSSDLENVLNPEERVDLEDMIEAYTINCAKALFREEEMGSIAPGKQANLVILDKNIFEIPVDHIYLTDVEQTYYRGDVVYEK